jgi:competence protein ComEC
VSGPSRAPDWRLSALAGATLGVGASPFLPALGSTGLALALAAAVAVTLLRTGGRWSRAPLIAATAAMAGVALGGARLDAIDAGALDRVSDRPVTATGFVTAVPRRADGTVSVQVSTADGRLLVEAPEPIADLPVGREISATGTLREPEDWQAGYLRVHGIAVVLAADAIELTGARRGGVAGLTDGVRDRAQAALERGMAEPEAALARGFVLGQDDRIDPATVSDFKRSGLAHLLAVSGQNVVLLGLLAVPLLAALGLSLRARLVCILILIAVYVPVTGAGPSIQRAGLMGAAGIVAALAGRPRSRWYALVLAAFATLVLNPRAAADVGWQLSFAAVAGILLWSAPLRDLLLGSAAGRGDGASIRRGVVEGAALTIAATMATAPLMAHHFESFSIVSLPANLLALPAVAPVMWLGMLSAMLGQVTPAAAAPLNAVCGLAIGYIAWVAHVFGTAGWAQARIRLSAEGVAAVYAILLGAGAVAALAARRRAALAVTLPRCPPSLLAALAVAVAAAVAIVPWRGGAPTAAASPELEVSVLDVGQGDAILLEPASGDDVLIDSGPPGDGIAEMLADEGVGRLALLLVTHDQLDHAGAVSEVLGSVPVSRFAYASAGRELLGAATAAGATPLRVGAPRRLRAGRLRLDVIWPPRQLLPSRGDGPAPAGDPNALSIVAVARIDGFSMLLTGDAEAETVPLDPGPLDVLKVSHHGSEDAGLDELLDRTLPRLAVISVGDSNPYGHPTPATLSALQAHHVAVMRTDLDGQVEIDVTADGWTVRAGVG